MLNNTGSVLVQNGSLALGGGGSDSGSFTIGSGNNLTFSGPTTVAAAATLNVIGAATWSGPISGTTAGLTITGTGTLTLSIPNPTIMTFLKLLEKDKRDEEFGEPIRAARSGRPGVL